MSEVKNFVLGFTLSILGFTIYNQEATSISPKQSTAQPNVKIDLFKEKSFSTNTHVNLIPIEKETILSAPTALQQEKNTKDLLIADTSSINGIEDDEILNINIEGIIPIEINNEAPNSASFSNSEKEEKVALLPSNNLETEASPWSITQTSRSKNKLSIPQINTSNTPSYKVAEKIKQSIIFPIPEEILSDENLTPTFIKPNQPDKAQKNKTKTQDKPKIIQKKPITPIENKTKDTSIFSNISSWFSEQNKDKKENNKTKAPAPVYSSQQQYTPTQTKTTTTNKKQTTQNIGDFYEALQNTKKDYIKNNIVPTELKLSFNKGRAEISGQTLRWLKAFSEKSLKDNYQLQVRLDGSAPAELQKKRLNLLYTIFTNHGVNIDNVDTAFSNVEPNTFIIRTIRTNKTSF